MKLAVRDSCNPKATARDFLLHSDPKQASAEILAPQTLASSIRNRFFWSWLLWQLVAVLEDLLRLDRESWTTWGVMYGRKNLQRPELAEAEEKYGRGDCVLLLE